MNRSTLINEAYKSVSDDIWTVLIRKCFFRTFIFTTLHNELWKGLKVHTDCSVVDGYFVLQNVITFRYFIYILNIYFLSTSKCLINFKLSVRQDFELLLSDFTLKSVRDFTNFLARQSIMDTHSQAQPFQINK